MNKKRAATVRIVVSNFVALSSAGKRKAKKEEHQNQRNNTEIDTVRDDASGG